MVRRALIFKHRLKRFLCAFSVLFCLSFAVESRAALIPGSEPQGEARIRVRLQDAASVVAIRGYDLLIYQTFKGSSALADAPREASSWEFRCEGDRVQAVSARGGQTLNLQGPVTLSTPAGLLSMDNRPYRDQIRIYPNGSFCEVVNELGIEKYLVGLVNSEFNSKWNESSTEAQVIAARTYALYQIRAARLQVSAPHFDVESTVHDQVYDGYLSEDYRGAVAVQKTRGTVIMASAGNGKGLAPIKAFYSSTCAGHTELPENVWGASFAGFKRIVSCPYCGQSPSIAWNLELSGAELERLIRQGAAVDGSPAGWPRNWRSLSRLVGLQAGMWTASARRSEVITTWIDPSGRTASLRVPAARFRNWVGAARFRSTAFEVRPSAHGGWSFNGRGNGHGVGMCQWGAKVMGDRGYSAVAILQHYYPDGVLRRLW
jgi:stage II sporulation protein D